MISLKSHCQKAPERLLEYKEILAYIAEKDLSNPNQKSDNYFSNPLLMNHCIANPSMISWYLPIQIARPDNIEVYLSEDINVSTTKLPYSLSIEERYDYKNIKILYDDNFLPYSLSLIDENNEEWDMKFSYFNKEDVTHYNGRVSLNHHAYEAYVNEFQKNIYKRMNIKVHGDFISIPSTDEYDPVYDLYIRKYGDPVVSKNITVNMSSNMIQGGLKCNAFFIADLNNKFSVEGELAYSVIGYGGTPIDEYLSNLFYNTFFYSPALRIVIFKQFKDNITSITYSSNQTIIKMYNSERMRSYEIAYNLQGYLTYLKANENNVLDITATISYSYI